MAKYSNMYFPELRTAISNSGWITMISDPQNWIFNAYIGDLTDTTEVSDAFGDHVLSTCEFVDKVRQQTSETVDDGQAYARNSAKWLDHKLAAAKNPLAYRSGITIPSGGGPIVFIVPHFRMHDPRSIAVLAHEIIHVAIIFREKLHIVGDECGEFVANVHTTLFERLLSLMLHKDVYNFLWPKPKTKKTK